jgi:hypothetical protein
MKRAIYITVFSLACMTPAAGAAIIVMCMRMTRGGGKVRILAMEAGRLSR